MTSSNRIVQSKIVGFQTDTLWVFGPLKTYPIPSMYGIFPYIYHKNQPNVGKYTIHGSYRIYLKQTNTVENPPTSAAFAFQDFFWNIFQLFRPTKSVEHSDSPEPPGTPWFRKSKKRQKKSQRQGRLEKRVVFKSTFTRTPQSKPLKIVVGFNQLSITI